MRFESNRLRLFAGRLIVLTIHSEGVWLGVDPATESSALSSLPSWRWDPGRWKRYRRVSSRNGYYSPQLDNGSDWALIQPAHFDFLSRAVTEGIAPDHRTAAKHDSDAVAYVRHAMAVGTPVATPSAPALSYGHALEGEPRLVVHLRRERDPTLVNEKRKAARNANGDLACEACGFVASITYGDLGADLCEVHHRRPLGDSPSSTVTQLHDLAILCPTCHRAIHRTRPMLSVQAFRERYVQRRR